MCVCVAHTLSRKFNEPSHLKPLSVGQCLLHVHSEKDGGEGQEGPGNEHEYSVGL